MTRPFRALPALLAGAVVAVSLAGCAPDPDVVTEHAEAVFLDLVEATAAIDEQTLRTLETAEPAELACGDDDAHQEVFSATGTLAVAADEGDVVDVFEAVRGRLSAKQWDAIGYDRDLTQRAWADRDGVVVAVTASGSVVTVSVFTPCLS